MAARWASVGACENAGVAIMNIAAAIDAQSIAARFDVSIIWINPFASAGSRRFNRRDDESIGREILPVGDIICTFALAASQLCKPQMTVT
jgi:hypothetical protein